EGQRVSIAEYFQQAYNLCLRYHTLPCLHVGAPQKKNYLPLKACDIIAGQKCPRQVTDKQVTNMTGFTCKRPDQRKRSIDQKFGEGGFKSDPGLNVEPSMVKTAGRQLPPPKIEYSGGIIEKPCDGSWNMRDKKFNTSAQPTSWTIFSTCDSSPPILLNQRQDRSVQEMFQAAVHAANQTFKTPPQLVWIINPVFDAHACSELKMMPDTEAGVGIVLRCMLSKHIRKCSLQYIANILMKVNTKLGGRNGVISDPLPCVSARTNIFGADVIRHRVEQIVDMKDMAIEPTKQFYRQTARVKPDCIVFYRDGVSEGQFHMVVNYDVTAVREACQFYLMSHAGLQGTSRPTHYHLLVNEVGFTGDDLQTLTYNLCYTFARCTWSVWMVPSVYYSHLVAFRARFFQTDGCDTISTVSGFDEAVPETNTGMHDVHENMKGAMTSCTVHVVVTDCFRQQAQFGGESCEVAFDYESLFNFLLSAMLTCHWQVIVCTEGHASNGGSSNYMLS
ncbi:Argonaute1, partial [Phytophthora megakarya]